MSQHPRSSRPSRLRSSRPDEAGWVLAASLILATMATAVTITYARHALLAKRTLEYGQGASEVDEASRSELERVRELMRVGDKPGTEENGDHDQAVTPTGEVVRGEREVIDHGRRELRVRAEGNENNSDEQARLRARSYVVPGNRPSGERTVLECGTGTTLLAGADVTVISGNQTFQDQELTGFFLLEQDAVLTLQDCILHGAIVTRHGACRDVPPAEGSHRPRVIVYGGLRVLSRPELPDVAIVAPDLRFETDSSSRCELRGFVSADEVHIEGRGCVRGMVVHNTEGDVCSKTCRPGFGRGCQDWPDSISCGAEEVGLLSFPVATVADTTLAAMDSCEIH